MDTQLAKTFTNVKQNLVLHTRNNSWMLRAILNKSWRQYPQGNNYTANCFPSRKLYKLYESDTQDTAGEAGTSSSVMYSYWPPHMAKQKKDDQLEHTYSSYVRIRDVVLKTCQKRWMIGRSGERKSGISVLAIRHDDNDDAQLYGFKWISLFNNNNNNNLITVVGFLVFLSNSNNFQTNLSDCTLSGTITSDANRSGDNVNWMRYSIFSGAKKLELHHNHHTQFDVFLRTPLFWERRDLTQKSALF